MVAGLFLVAQQIEGNLLVPRIQGGSVGVHPLVVLFATLAGTALYGMIGAIFAVPVVAIVAATLRYLRGTLLFERWGKPPVKPVRGEPEKQAIGHAVDARRLRPHRRTRRTKGDHPPPRTGQAHLQRGLERGAPLAPASARQVALRYARSP